MAYDHRKAAEMLLACIPKRSAAVLEKRYGLGKSGKRHTLEAIGAVYGITRERVRQIECDGMNRIRKAAPYAELQPLFLSFKDYIASEGIIAEDRLFAHFHAPGSENSRPATRFLLVLAPQVLYRGESEAFYTRWGTDGHRMDAVERALQSVADSIKLKPGTISFPVLSSLLQQELAVASSWAPQDDILAAYIGISKKIGKNSFDQWGHTSSPLVRPRGVRDLAYLVFAKVGVPMHFSVAAERIREVAFPRRVHAQTVHNELIKDKRFVLVGRGTYGLTEWGYEPGTVRDIITRVLTPGPRSRESVIEEVLAKRQVKGNTILINLQNRKYFQKLSDGMYSNVI